MNNRPEWKPVLTKVGQWIAQKAVGALVAYLMPKPSGGHVEEFLKELLRSHGIHL